MSFTRGALIREEGGPRRAAVCLSTWGPNFGDVYFSNFERERNGYSGGMGCELRNDSIENVDSIKGCSMGNSVQTG